MLDLSFLSHSIPLPVYPLLHNYFISIRILFFCSSLSFLANMEQNTIPMLAIVFSVWVLMALTLSSNPTMAASASRNCHFPAIINFGDSNSDTGGLSAAFGQAGPPHGETFFHHPAGRYCDGRLIIDFIGIYFTFIFSFFHF